MTDLTNRLRIEVGTAGDGKIVALAGELEKLSAGAGEAAPKFVELANELKTLAAQDALIQDFARLKRETVDAGAALDAAATKVDQLAQSLADSADKAAAATTAQHAAVAALGEAREKHDALKLAVGGAANELRELKDRARESGAASVEYGQQIEAAKAKLDALKVESRDAGAAVKTLATDQRSALGAQREAEAAQRTLTREYTLAETAAKNLSGQLGSQRQALASTESALREAGVGVTGLSAKQAELKGRLLEAARQVESYTAALGQMRAEAGQLAPALESTFKQLGIRSVREVTAEIEHLQATMRGLKGQKLLPEDAERAAAALQARIATLRGELSGTHGSAKQAAQGVREVGSASDTAGQQIGNAAHKAAAWAASLVGLNAATNVARNIVETGSAFEQLERRLASMLGSTDAATAAFAEIKELARTTPFEVRDLTESYAKLTAFGLQPSMEQMRALADTAATLGGGTEALSGLTLALGQAWTKGKLQGEEILQMAERGVPVWDLLAQVTGKNVEQLQKMASAGQLGRDVIVKLMAALGDKNAGASAELMATFAGAVSNAHDALDEFFALVADSGVLDYLTAKIQSLLAEFDRMREAGELDAAAQRIADGFIAVGEAAEMTVSLLQTLSPAIETALNMWAASKILKLVEAMRAIPAAAGAAAAASATAGQTIAASSAAAATQVGVLAGALRLVRFAGYTAIAAELIDIGSNVAKLIVQNEKLRVAEESLEGTQRRAAERYRQISEATGVTVRSMQELDAAVADGQIRFDAATATWMSTARAMESADAAARKLRESAAALAAQEWGHGVRQAGELATALEGAERQAALATIKVGDLERQVDLLKPDGLVTMTQAFGMLEASGSVAADVVRNQLQAALAKLSTTDLSHISEELKAAFDQGKISAADFARMNDEVLAASFARLGLKAEQALGGIGTEAKAAIQALDGIRDSLERSGVTGEQRMNALGKSITAALSRADTIAAVDALKSRIVEMGNSGELAGQRLTSALDEVEQKLKGMALDTDPLEKAFRNLGVASQQSLAEAANAARRDFNTIRDSGLATTGELKNAFAAYAERAIAANGGVASATLRVEAAQNNLRLAADQAGNVIVLSMTEAAAALGATGERADELAAKFAEIASGAADAADTFDRWQADIDSQKSDAAPLGTGARAGHSGWEDWTGAELNAVVRNRRNPPDLIAGAQREIARRNEEFRRKQEEEEDRLRREAEERLGGGFTPGQPVRAPGAGAPAPGQSRAVPERVVQVNLNVGGNGYPLFGAPADVDRFLTALETAQRSAG